MIADCRLPTFSMMHTAVNIQATLTVERAIQVQLAALKEAEDKASDDDMAKALAFLAVLVPQLGEAEVGGAWEYGPISDISSA